MVNTEIKWYTNWEREFAEDYVTTLKKESVQEILNYYHDFLGRQLGEKQHEVLNAQPGHGKTTALKVFIRRMIDLKLPIGGLIVLREKEQMREIEQFASVREHGVLYVDSENYQEVKPHLGKYQFVIISHERLRNLTLNVLENGQFSSSEFTIWEGSKRMIIIDEAPDFVDSVSFAVDDKLAWLDECFKAAKEDFSSEEIIMNRSLFQILLATELLENKGPLTGPLNRHLDSPRFAAVLSKFFTTVDKHIYEITSSESLSKYKWFKKLSNQDQVGYIDTGLYLDGYSDHKRIICSRRIDYRELKCSILILDGTAAITEMIYNGDYTIQTLGNFTCYERLEIHQRMIKTSASRRKGKQGLMVRQLIAKDIESIQQHGIHPFPLMNKSEIDDYKKLKVIKEDYEKYFQNTSENSILPINLLNTKGKNYLANQNSLYLTTLPNRPPIHYKAIAISLYKNDKVPLNLSMTQKEKKNNTSWFADPRIENIYLESLISELIQIIHRCNIRNLLVSAQQKIHIYVATHYKHILVELVSKLGEKIQMDHTPVEESLKLQMEAEQKVKLLLQNIKEKNIILPLAVGRIVDGSAVKTFINREWKNEENRQLIVDVFNHHGLNIIHHKTKSGSIEKRIDLLRT
nr:DEAD/DEAH box helicase family protein [Priestia megaterium]